MQWSSSHTRQMNERSAIILWESCNIGLNYIDFFPLWQINLFFMYDTGFHWCVLFEQNKTWTSVENLIKLQRQADHQSWSFFYSLSCPTAGSRERGQCCSIVHLNECTFSCCIPPCTQSDNMNNAKSFKGLATTKTKHLGNKANSDQTAAAKAWE